jgi:hypothetical protein
MVFFTCAAGSAPGRWMGGDPVRTGSFDVEFEIPDDVVEWAPATSAIPAISGRPEAGSAVHIECEVVRVGDGNDSVVEARLGPDVLLVDVLSRRSDLSVGTMISLQVGELRLHPYDL